MKCYFHKIGLYIIFLMLFSLLNPSSISYAANGSDSFYIGDSDSIYIWNGNHYFENQGNTYYQFTVDVLGISFDIEHLVIMTNYGNLEFENLSGSHAGRYANASLFSDQEINAFRILQAIGTINGKQYDLTNIIIPREHKSIPII